MEKADKLLCTSKTFSVLKKGKLREGGMVKKVNKTLTGVSGPGSTSIRKKKLAPLAWHITRVFRHAESPPTGHVSELPLKLLGSCRE